MKTKSKPKLLVFIPSPRNIPEVKEQIEKILYQKHDVIWFKFYKEIEAYEKAREYFLASKKNYDYFVILPDDLIINQEGFDLLLKTLKENPEILVLSGICNLSCVNSQQLDTVTASIESIPILRGPNHKMMPWKYYPSYKDLENMKENVIKARYVGFSLCFIHKKVLKKVKFSQMKGLGIDLTFAADLEDAGIDQYLHKKASFFHLKGLSATKYSGCSVNPDVILVSRFKPVTIFVDS